MMYGAGSSSGLGCFSASQAEASLFLFGMGLLSLTLFLGTSWEGHPLSQLGVRPMGRGLWTWLWNSFTKVESHLHVVGVWGYDPILGSWSPPLRLCLHSTVICWLWAALLKSIASMNTSGVLTTTSATCDPSLLPSWWWWSCGLASAGFYSFGQFLIQVTLPGVSVPGGPRPHKIQRTPAWNPTPVPMPPAISSSQWRFVTAQTSHVISQSLGPGVVLTGEPSGRDMWTTSTTDQAAETPKLAVSDQTIWEWASGGRPDTCFNPAVNPNSADIPFRAQMIQSYLAAGNKPPNDMNKKASTIEEALHKAVQFYAMLQTEDGHWSGDYGGPHFLMPGLIVAWYVMGRPILMLDTEAQALMKHYIVVHQQADGGWGTHLESPSTMFGTTLMYVSLRLLGASAEDAVCRRGRAFLQKHGGALMTSSWAKLYLCILGCMEWDGHNSVPPEMWLLPNWFPFHPGRMWCHARMVYLPMGYLYGSRFVYPRANDDETVLALRKELYCEPYESISWIRTRHMVAPMDNYSPISLFMKTAQNILARYETWPIFQPLKNWLRQRGLVFCLDYMAAEDRQTNFIDIGPVNKVLNMLSAFHASGFDIKDPKVRNHMVRVADYLWVAEDGMKMKGYNGSQCWDTSFAIQAVYEAGLLDAFPTVSKKVWNYLERCQILSTEVSQSTPAYEYESAANRCKYYRHLSEGGWPFSTSAHGWPITDCTGEGLKGVLCLLKSQAVQKGLKSGELRMIGERRLQNAVNVLLTYQNEDGGFATYENNRGYGWYEWLNPSEVFGDICIDYSYVECSMAVLTALADFHEAYPRHRADEVAHAIDKGRRFLKSIQRDDGSWYGSWACCFCYAVWFGIEGLIKCGESYSSESITKACNFLVRHQRSNGGWGEDFTSCYDKDYANDGMLAYGDDGSGVVNTAWALMALSVAHYKDVDVIRRGVQYLMKRQLPTGDWPQEGIAGVFNRACGITYTAYRNVFPIWALGRCREVYGRALDTSN